VRPVDACGDVMPGDTRDAVMALGGADSVCCVVDLDMFYAQVEIRDRPELKVRVGPWPQLTPPPPRRQRAVCAGRISLSPWEGASSARPTTWRGSGACARLCPGSSVSGLKLPVRCPLCRTF
jgi:hypothetical protein